MTSTQLPEITFSTFLGALVYPFRTKNWPLKMWWVPLIAYIPVLNFVMLYGWRVAVIRQVGTGQEHELPAIGKFAKFLVYGFTTMIFGLIYGAVPIILAAIFGLELFTFALDLALWIWQNFFSPNDVSASLGDIFASAGIEITARVLIPLIFGIFLLPLFRAARIRYALTEKKRVFLDIPGNFAMVLNNLEDFLVTWLFIIMIDVILYSVSFLFLATAVGSVLIPLLSFPFFLWSTAYLHGTLARKVVLRRSFVAHRGSQHAAGALGETLLGEQLPDRTSDALMRCSECDEVLVSGARFCQNCGARAPEATSRQLPSTSA